MDFMSALNNTKHVMEEQQNSFDNDEQFPTSKNPILRFDKNTSTRIVRILPSIKALNGTLTENEDPLGAPFRTIFLQTRTPNGKDINTSINMNIVPDPNSPFEQNLARWIDEKKLDAGPGRQYDVRPRKMAFVNAIELFMNPATNVLEPATDPATGQPLIQVLQLPFSAYSKIIDKLANPLMAPAGSTMSFVGLDVASPVQIVKPAKGSADMSYSVDVYTNIALPALDQNYVMSNLEDIYSLASPSELVTPQWVESVSAWMDGRAPERDGQEPPMEQAPQGNPYSGGQPAFGGMPQGQPQMQAPATPAQNPGFTSAPEVDPNQYPFGGMPQQQQQAPVATQPQPQMQTPVAPQPQMQAPVAPQAPVAQQAPAQESTDPLAGMPAELAESLRQAMGGQN